MRFIGFVLAALLLGACSKADLLQKFSSPETQAQARNFISKLQARDFDPIVAALDPSMMRGHVRATLTEMADAIPSQQPSSVTVVGARSMVTPGAKTTNTTFEYAFGEKYFLINVAVRDRNGRQTIVGFNVAPEARSLEAQNHFGLSGKSKLQYLVLALVCVLPLFTLYALVVCARSKLTGRKWPWILFIIFGLGKVAVNWTTGQWQLVPLAFQLLSASAFAEFYGPWILSASVPVGAIVFLLRRKRLMAAAAA